MTNKINYDEYFTVKEETHLLDGSDEEIKMETAYSVIDGSYVGPPEYAKHLVDEYGIKPEAREDKKTSSIGWSERDQKWYGWSHRAIYGFHIGSEVTKGHCAYIPSNMEEALEDAKDFWLDEYHEDTYSEVDPTNDRKIIVSWVYGNETPNEKLRGTKGKTIYSLPLMWGKGEWVAETLEDAKQMACDFAEGVS